MSLIKTSADILSQSPKENWEDSLLAFFDMASKEMRLPKDGATDIYRRVQEAASALEIEMQRRDLLGESNIIQTALRNWWSVASMHEDTLWDMRPFPRGRKYKVDSMVKKTKSWSLPPDLWRWLEGHDNQSEVIRKALSLFRKQKP